MTLENEVNVLHLSDLHFGIERTKKYSKEAKEKRKETLNSLKQKLKVLNEEWKPNIIVITGDIGFIGKNDDYNEAWKFIHDILETFDLDSRHVILCPGNHDRDLDQTKGIAIPVSPFEADEKLSIENLVRMSSPFEVFSYYCEKNNIEPLLLDNLNHYLVGYRELFGLRFIVLNSAWFSVGGKNDTKNYIGLPHIRKMKLANQLATKDNFDTDPITIALLHHPPKWLHEAESDCYEGRAVSYQQLSNGCHAILSGHSHGERILSADKKHARAWLFKIGATYAEQNYSNNCEILKIRKKSRFVERLKLYYVSGETEWKDEIDYDESYDLHYKNKAYLSKEEILERAKSILKNDPDLVPRNSCDLPTFLRLLSNLLPQELPGLETGHPAMEKPEKIPSQKIEELKAYIDEVYQIQDQCFNFKNDWFSQRVWFLVGNFWYFIKDYQKALNHYILLTSYNPVTNTSSNIASFDKRIIWFNMGVVLDDLGRYDEALESCEKVLELDQHHPTNSKTWYNMGVILKNLGRHDEALEAYEKALKIDPKDSKAWNNMGIMLKNFGRHDEALEAYKKALKADPTNSKAWLNMGVMLSNFGRHDEALEAYEKALKIDPTNSKAWFNMGVTLSDFSRHDGALEAYKKALKIDPKDIKAWFNMGVTLKNLGRYDEALEACEKVLELDPKDIKPWNNIGGLLHELGRQDEALKVYEKALKIDPKDRKLWYNMGGLLHELGRHEEALEAYEKALNIDPTNSKTWYNMGVTLSNFGRHDKALEAYEKTLKIDPKDSKAWFNMGVTLENLGRHEEALEAYEKALKIDPKDSKAWNNMGGLLYGLGRHEEALKAYEKVLEHDPEDVKAKGSIESLKKLL